MSRSIIDRTFGQNKPRLLYPRGVVKEDDVKVHTALLYVPKEPEPSAKETICEQCRRGEPEAGMGVRPKYFASAKQDI